MEQFLKRKNVIISFRRYAIDALGAMALGLFSSLIIGLILREAGTKAGVSLLVAMGEGAMQITGAAIGVSVAHSLKAPPLVLFSSAATGFAGNELGGPAGAFVAALIGAEIGKLVFGETKVDIIVAPVATIASGFLAGSFVGTLINALMLALGRLIMWSTELLPVPMGIVVSVVMGMALTAPISSAALGIMLDLKGIAAGAACAGCCANMVGFAVSGYRENGIGGLISVGIGTSMLQVPNIMKNPRIWIPPIAASVVTGPVSASVFKLKNIPSGAGMGTSGLVGQFGALSATGYTPDTAIKIAVTHFLLPALVSFILSELLRKIGWIKFGDMKL